MPRSRSSATPTASRARSWSSRCRCWTRSRRRSSVRSRTASARPSLCIRQVDEGSLLREAYREAGRLALEDGLVALIVPDELVEPALAHESAFDSIPLLTPREAKGLEFDHVIVVEPALVAAHDRGLRELYVALTRPTTTLVVVHARPLPAELGL